MKSGVYSIKTVLVSEDQNVLMNNSIFINKYSRFKELVIQYEPTLYKRHCFKKHIKL